MAEAAEDDWIPSADALNLTIQRTGQSLHKAILERARDGLIRARAINYIVTKHQSSRIDYSEENIEGQKLDDGVLLPRKFFWAGAGAAMNANWITGDFSTWIDRTWECRAYGIHFSRRDVERLAPIVSNLPSSSPAPAKKHTMSELQLWITRAPTTNADLALKFYKLDSRYNGIKQDEFRQLWQRLKGTTRGAQKKPKS